METKNTLRFTPEVVVVPVFMVLLLWVIFWLEIRFHIRFTRLGIYPLEWEGLPGIVLGPFIHGSLQHLFNNSIPLLVLTSALFYFYRSLRWKVLLVGLLLTGVATWVMGRPAWHIGASGVIYMLAAFLFFKGIFSKQFQLTALSLLVVFLYGGMLWYLFPIDPKISWEGHLSGFMIGLVLAVLFKNKPLDRKKYEWEKDSYDPNKDPFLQHFDEDGNFIESAKEEPKPLDITPGIKKIRVVYNYLPKKTEEE